MDLPYKTDIDAYQMLESMTESVLITTTELESPGPYIIYVNPAFEEMTGWKREEIIGANPRILQGAKTDFSIFQDLRNRLLKGEMWSGRTINYKKDGSDFVMEWSIVPISDEHNQVYRYLAVQKDVSKIVRTEQKLEKSREKAKSRLLQIEEQNKQLSELIKQQKETLELFVKYVPETIVKRALDGHSTNIKKGEELEVALLFCDIRRFTTIAEQLDPEQTVHFLNVYYSMMSEVIKKHDGVINQFVGDEIFVSFGAPTPIDHPELCAVQCAHEMVAKLDEINEALRTTIDEKVVIGIGINYGPIIAGNLGSDDRLSYSITGDAVNTAKRIESLTVKLPNAILISEAIYTNTKDHISAKPWGEVKIKGKNQRVNVYQLLDLLPS